MGNTLTAEEFSCLEDAVHEYPAELHTEIHDTDDYRFKVRLKRKEELLRGILGKLEQAHVAMN